MRGASIASVIAALALAGPAAAAPGSATSKKSAEKPTAPAKAGGSAKRKRSPKARAKKKAKPSARQWAAQEAKVIGAKRLASGKMPTSKPGLVDLFTLRPVRHGAPRRVDLFPPNLFERGELSPISTADSEHRKGLGLGNDGGWRTQTAQIGAMALGFAALAGLCGGGKCLIPNSWVPGPLQAKPYVVPNPVVPQTRRGTDLGRGK